MISLQLIRQRHLLTLVDTAEDKTRIALLDEVNVGRHFMPMEDEAMPEGRSLTCCVAGRRVSTGQQPPERVVVDSFESCCLMSLTLELAPSSAKCFTSRCPWSFPIGSSPGDCPLRSN